MTFTRKFKVLGQETRCIKVLNSVSVRHKHSPYVSQNFAGGYSPNLQEGLEKEEGEGKGYGRKGDREKGLMGRM
jgi:hypothetical protein